MSVENINILFLVMITLGLFGVVAGRFFLPNKFWLALLVCAVLGLRYGRPYFFAVVMINWGLQSFGIDNYFKLFITYMTSIFLMILRFKIDSIKQIEQKS